MFRYDRPQRGRYREFWQLNVEAMGAADAALDAEVIRLYHDLLGRLGLRRYWLELNSIGDRRCRPAYIDELNGWLDAHPDVLTPEVVQKRDTSPLRVFDVKDERVRSQLAQAPKIGESLCDDCRRHFDDVRRYLDAYGVPYTISPTLVRGLDYYTRTAFEFLGEALGAKDSICGGGRYDYLIEEIGGPPTPGVGWAAGIERLVIQLQEEGRAADADRQLDVFVVADERARVDAAGLAADVDYAGRSDNAQIKHANRLGPRYVVILAGDKATVRERGRDDREVARGELVAELRS
jgi:histidyl-tRNA synthetase